MDTTQKFKGNVWEKATFSLLVIIILVLVGSFYWYYHRAHSVVAMCATSNLSLSMGTSDGTAGTIYRHAVITNNGSTTCTLGGYPAAFLVDNHGSQLGSGAASNALYTPVSITLAHGQAAHTVLGFPDAGNFDPGICSASSTNLRIYPPGSLTALEVASTEKSCPGFSISALQPGV
ncbi:MAG TPA: DUF4232 domain-containing protein [Candidatus Saccharimonadales bacterium]|jgi:hypothetical protein|nr:DUF4232 domain-containing protein [Candidatus Saccharimonadales bacterium]